MNAQLISSEALFVKYTRTRVAAKHFALAVTHPTVVVILKNVRYINVGSTIFNYFKSQKLTLKSSSSTFDTS